MTIDSSFPSAGSPADMRDHPDTDLPDPGYQPAMQHSTQMAGDVIPFPIDQRQSDFNRLLSGVILKRGGNPNTGKGPAKVLRGPGSND